MKKFLMLVLVALLALGATGVAAQDGTIVDVAVADGSFTTLVAAVEAAGLVETLSGEGPFTVFAPTDDAFAALDEGTVDFLLANTDILASVLTYHVVAGQVMAEDVLAMEGATEVATVNGAEATVDPAALTIEGANIVATDVMGSNGVIHVIDAVILPPIDLPAVDPLALSGDVILNGSSTVGPLSIAMGEQFTNDGFAGVVDVTITGSGTGLNFFCGVEQERDVNLDIANASRMIREGEIEACIESGVPPIEFNVGVDALSVVVSQENDFVDALTLAQLSDIFTGAVTTWNEVNDMWPEETIQLFSPGEESGTFLYFVEEVIQNEDGGNIEDEFEAVEATLGTPGIQTSADDNVLAQGVEGSPFAIGYFGFAYFVAEGDALRAVGVDAGDGPVLPSQETAEAGEYFLARPLFIYSSAPILNEKPQVAGFVNYYITNVNQVLMDAATDPAADYRYFPANDQLNRLAKLRWLIATTDMMMDDM
ncbi:MAG: phosphate-binding protein [Chloroflexi bacterium]|nr:phosphate-binding protein [Chloroflexota bacterium]